MLRHRRAWVFDLDGTLTLAQHDFEAIRRELGLPPGPPILEALEALPPGEAEPLYRRLDEIEIELAATARPQPGSSEVLEYLAARGMRLGILTRNTLRTALETLRVTGLDRFFPPCWVLGREASRPKPDPEGLLKLLADWAVAPDASVMVGDFLFDLQAGRSAGTATVYVDPSRAFPWAVHADLSIGALDELLDHLEARPARDPALA